MISIRYFKADSSTYVIRTSGGKVRARGRGLSFFYNALTASIVAVPLNVQESPFLFSLQTADYQTVRVQGQISYRIVEPEVIAALLNYNLTATAQAYVSEDPVKLGDQVVRMVQTIVQDKMQRARLRQALALSQPLVEAIKEGLGAESPLAALGIGIVDVAISSVSSTPETARALEAEARESILKEADDAIYARRKSAVEQERMIKEAELKTRLIVQDKEQEIEESRVANERAILRGTNETERERLAARIEAESRRAELVGLEAVNTRQVADAEAYALAARMNAFAELPVENLKALALTSMQPDQLMALALDGLARNAAKIGELNIGPDLFERAVGRGARK